MRISGNEPSSVILIQKRQIDIHRPLEPKDVKSIKFIKCVYVQLNTIKMIYRIGNDV